MKKSHSLPVGLLQEIDRFDLSRLANEPAWQWSH